MIFSSIHEMANFMIYLFLENESCTANINIISIQSRVGEECCSIPLEKQQHEAKHCS
jgi:hypothetical protein